MFGGNVIKGVFLLASGRAIGIAEFGGSNDALLASLAPRIAFTVVLAALTGLQGRAEAALILFLSQLSAFLAVSVLTQGFAAWAGRDALWIRTATVLNWSFWFLIIVILLANGAQAILVSAGVPEPVAYNGLMLALGIYIFWYQWFTVRIGLQVSIMASAGILIVTNMVVGLILIGPALIDHLMLRH